VPRSSNRQRVVRRDWLSTVTSNCQLCAGLVTKPDPDSLKELSRLLLEVLPPPANIAESLALRCLMLELYLQLDFNVARVGIPNHIRDEARRQWLTGVGRARDSVRAFERAAAILRRAMGVRPAHAVHERAKLWVEANWQNSRSVQDAAHELAVHPRTLMRHFSKAFGVSLHQYRTQLRVGYAVKLLRETEIKIEAIPTMVGYRSKPSFYRAVYQAMGKSPLAIRRSER
jgi:AraC-like DNA-binding protein